MGKWTTWIMWKWWYNQTQKQVPILWDILYLMIVVPDSYYVIVSHNIQSVYNRELLGWKASCHRTVILDSFLRLVCSILYFPRALLHLDNYVMPDLVFAPTIGPKHWHIVANSANRLCMMYRLCVLQNNCRCHVHVPCRCFICTIWSGVNSK